MVSLRRFVGKVPFERALRRTGRVSSSKIPVTRQYHLQERQTAISELKNQLYSELAVSKNSNHVISLNRQIQLLRSIAELEKIPKSFDVVAALAWQHGLGKEKLLPWVGSLDVLKQKLKQKNAMLLDGDPKFFSECVGLDLPKRIEKIALSQKKVFSSRELAQALGARPQAVQNANLLLEAMGLMKRLPPETKGKPGPELRRVHVEHRFLAETIPKQNSAFNIMKTLAGGKKSLLELSQIVYPEKPSKFRQAPAKNIYSPLDLLLRQGIIQATRVQGKQRTSFEYSLTKKGLDAMQKQANRNSLHPTVSEILLGKPKKALSFTQERRYDRIVKAIKAIILSNSMPVRKQMEIGTKKAAVAAAVGVTPKMGSEYVTGRQLPWTKVQPKTLHTVFLPQMKRRNPVEAEWFARYLKNQKQPKARPLNQQDKEFASELAEKHNYKLKSIQPKTAQSAFSKQQKTDRLALIKERYARLKEPERRIAKELETESEFEENQPEE